MSTPPRRSLAWPTTRSMSSTTAMSATTAYTSPPVFAVSSARVSSSVAAVRAQITTRAPASSSRRADSRPIPRLPPVTIARLALMPRSMTSGEDGDLLALDQREVDRGPEAGAVEGVDEALAIDLDVLDEPVLLSARLQQDLE